MKPLAIFLVGLIVVFGAVAVLVLLSRPTERVFVVVDNAFPMREVWRQVPGALDDIQAQGFSEFALATEKDLIHSWQQTLRFRSRTPYAPCDFSEIEAYGEVGEADERVLITTNSSCPTDALAGWTVITLEP